MSGGGGGGHFSFEESKDCESLTIRTQIASPVPTVLAKLKVGDILVVRLTPPTGPVQLLTSTKELAGAVLSPDIAQLIQCLSDGHEYKAKVVEIKGGNCQILITHV